MAVTLSQIRAEAKELADETGSTFVTDAQWLIWINQGARQLHRAVYRAKAELLLARTTASITTANAVPNSSTIAVPAAALGVYALERDPSSTSRRFVPQISPLMGNPARTRLGYWVSGSNVHVGPAEFAAGDYALYYLAGHTALSGDSDTIASSVEPWWEFIAVYAAKKCVEKDKLDSSNLREELRRIEEDELRPQATNFGGILSAPIVDVEDIFSSDLPWDR